MDILFTMDAKNYTEDMPLIARYGVRGLIQRNGKWAMQYSDGGEYKIPGGGREENETNLETLIREIREETGLHVLVDSVREIGEVVEKRQDLHDETQRFEAHSYFYFCEVDDTVSELKLTPSEAAKNYHLEWADLETIIRNNEGMKKECWLDRDTGFLRWLKDHPELY